MIEIKGTRSPQKDADPAQKYVLNGQDAKSRSPYAIGIMLTAFVLYLKSMFPDTATRAFVEDEAAPQIPQEPELALNAYQITDFDAGDVIRTSKYKIFDAPDEASAALFNAVYNETAQAGQSGAREQIRYRYERGDDGDDSDANDMSSGHTIVEYDHDDVSMATIITLNGHHILVWSDIG
ncbi:hypothetical protein [Pseudogemmobacter sp. W21_MBD1_M6]|uniref:hypothetical protein n=1 Tax=Pseudogemmobacter sp. W21_MBD1_M6 TaxID=3240271 RepID=UPI003F985BB7